MFIFTRYQPHRPPSGQETTFVHNVVCDANVDADIMNCSADIAIPVEIWCISTARKTIGLDFI